MTDETCVICRKPTTGDWVRKLPDGCLVHDHCLRMSSWEDVRSHVGVLSQPEDRS